MKFNVNVDTAISAIEKNLKEHEVELKEATEVWLAKCVIETQALQDSLAFKSLDVSNEELADLFRKKPVDNSKDYKKFLGALKLSKEAGYPSVEMDDEDYDALFNDNWHWRQHGKVMNSLYRR